MDYNYNNVPMALPFMTYLAKWESAHFPPTPCWRWLLRPLFVETNDMINLLDSQYHGYACPGDARGEGISDHDIT